LAAFAKIKWLMKTRREEEVIIHNRRWPPARSRVFAGEGVSVLVQVASRLMQEHSWLGFEVSRVFIAQQNVPCFLLKAENLVCCRMK
jgi:hypothetical protein